MKTVSRTAFGLVVLWLTLATVTRDAEGNTCSRYSNGCSIPFGLWLPYKKTFTPACWRHDVCYICARHYGLSKSDCDDGFLAYMRRECSSRRRRHDLQKRGWLCRTVAKTIYYKAVDLFGYGFGEDEDWCSESWVPDCLPKI